LQIKNDSTQLEEVVADSCYQRKCTSNEHCCDGSICADTKFGGDFLKTIFAITLITRNVVQRRKDFYKKAV
jgi:hypothetical protein